MKIYGITGGIASGKSTVTQSLQEFGYEVMDLDLIARKLVTPGSEGLAKVLDLFGQDYAQEDGALDRKKLAALVFNDKAELEKLDNLMGPLMWQEVQRQSTELKGEIAFLDGALILEKGMNTKLAGTILVTAPVRRRILRAMERDGTTEKQVRARMNAQMSDSEKRRYADYVIDNDGTPHELHQQVVALVERLRQ